MKQDPILTNAALLIRKLQPSHLIIYISTPTHTVLIDTHDTPQKYADKINNTQPLRVSTSSDNQHQVAIYLTHQPDQLTTLPQRHVDQLAQSGFKYQPQITTLHALNDTHSIEITSSHRTHTCIKNP